MKLIVGLGNVGQKYTDTPHNVGFLVIDQLVNDSGDWTQEAGDRMKAEVYRGKIGEEDVLLAKPITMMNLSGEAVSRLAQFYKIKPEDIWIIYDELDLRLGRLKISCGGGNNGHNGLISVEEKLGHNRFWRFRIGVDGREAREIPGLEYVLRPYAEDELKQLLESVEMTAEAVKKAVVSSPAKAQEGYNKRTSLSENTSDMSSL